MGGTIQTLLKYLHPDPGILDEREAFDQEYSAEFFHSGNRTGCAVLHGIGGTPANVRPVADRLALEGYTVFAPVLPGHRTTIREMNDSTWQEWLSCAENAYDRLRAEGCDRIFMTGLSLGGILAGLVAEEADRPVAGLVQVCAPVRMKPFLQVAKVLSGLVPYVRYSEENRSRNRYDPRYSQMYDSGFPTRKLRDLDVLIRRFRGDMGKITCPVLFFQARYDNKVAEDSPRILVNGIPGGAGMELVYLEHSPHGASYGPERDLVAERTAAFVRRETE